MLASWFLARLILDPEHEVDTFLRNAFSCANYTALCSRRCQLRAIDLFELFLQSLFLEDFIIIDLAFLRASQRLRLPNKSKTGIHMWDFGENRRTSISFLR
jgi:hypothetical protein